MAKRLPAAQKRAQLVAALGKEAVQGLDDLLNAWALGDGTVPAPNLDGLTFRQATLLHQYLTTKAAETRAYAYRLGTLALYAWMAARDLKRAGH